MIQKKVFQEQWGKYEKDLGKFTEELRRLHKGNKLRLEEWVGDYPLGEQKEAICQRIDQEKHGGLREPGVIRECRRVGCVVKE